jgi:hypothetical protein
MTHLPSTARISSIRVTELCSKAIRAIYAERSRRAAEIKSTYDRNMSRWSSRMFVIDPVESIRLIHCYGADAEETARELMTLAADASDGFVNVGAHEYSEILRWGAENEIEIEIDEC